MKNIAKAIIQVMKEVKGMEKNSRVGSGGNAYSGTKDQDVKEIFNDALAKNGLCILPINIEEETNLDRWEAVDPWSKATTKDTKMYQSVYTKVKVKYMILHESGESIELAGYGHGVDPQDKGAGKATTYALKNCLLYTCLTPVGKIDDTETTHSDNIPTPAPKPVAAKKPTKPNLTKAIFDKVVKGSKEEIEAALKAYTISEDSELKLNKEIGRAHV